MTDFNNSKMTFTGGSVPHVTLDSGENADLFHYPMGEVASDHTRFLKKNHTQFGLELERRWNHYGDMKGWLRSAHTKLAFWRFYSAVMAAITAGIVVAELLR